MKVLTIKDQEFLVPDKFVNTASKHPYSKKPYGVVYLTCVPWFDYSLRKSEHSDEEIMMEGVAIRDPFASEGARLKRIDKIKIKLEIPEEIDGLDEVLNDQIQEQVNEILNTPYKDEDPAVSKALAKNQALIKLVHNQDVALSLNEDGSIDLFIKTKSEDGEFFFHPQRTFRNMEHFDNWTTGYTRPNHNAIL